MQMRTLGNDEISVIGFGAWEAGGAVWGEGPGDEGSIAAIRAALDAGITWLDTAEIYGNGRSEEVVGRAIAGVEPRPFVATKVASSVSGYSPQGVRKGAEGSLRRLGIEVIDLYQIHWPDESTTPLEETWQAMAALVDDGLARNVGVSNFNRDLIERCEPIRHVDSVQNQFSMLHSDYGRELFPWCGENGTAVLAYGPLAYGLLTGAIDMDTEFAEDDWRGRGSGMSYYEEFFEPGVRAKHLEKIEAMRPIADDLGITMSQLALAWVVAQPGVTSAIAGSRNPEHVGTNAEAGDVIVDQAKLDLLDEILGA
jgi:aryl-alcohol dehydrogenase-like predicted oxidoreductase